MPAEKLASFQHLHISAAAVEFLPLPVSESKLHPTRSRFHRTSPPINNAQEASTFYEISCNVNLPTEHCKVDTADI
jgi:hypothetical protein